MHGLFKYAYRYEIDVYVHTLTTSVQAIQSCIQFSVRGSTVSCMCPHNLLLVTMHIQYYILGQEMVLQLQGSIQRRRTGDVDRCPILQTIDVASSVHWSEYQHSAENAASKKKKKEYAERILIDKS